MLKDYQYTERKTFRFTKQQIKDFDELEKCNVNVSQFVRAAIKEKIQREWKTIKGQKQRFKIPF